MKRLIAVFVFAAVALGVMAKGGVSELKSPDGKVIVTIECDGALRISASQDGVTVLSPSEIGINTGAGTAPLKVKKTEKGSADRTITMPVYKRREVRDHYNEVRLTLSDGFPKPSKVTRVLRGKLDLQSGEARFLPTRQGNVVLSGTIGCDVYAVIPAGSGPLKDGAKLKGFLI
jgi:hypothetical protein